ncbi:hypothetical protein [Mycoplasma sp. Mirounga ES2805-ORL]|uniref:hypothetical protein n=1 Tax=Mycoplasma sp. Mirounga ES2805-ORL TaxID=754514 RepID=UPI00197C1603|nr:hypothetical protein [Mycoplasma sp. Mirounga ES2805-ORL]QSF13429.1 hypothetical protein JXZ90_02000 [Mycoplasma sp. Mirounga ES2805-ORL]
MGYENTKTNSILNQECSIENVYTERNIFQSLLNQNQKLKSDYEFFCKLLPDNKVLNSLLPEENKFKFKNEDSLSYFSDIEFWKVINEINYIQNNNKNAINYFVNISFSSNELNYLNEQNDDEKIKSDESEFIQETLSIDATSEVVINKVEWD